MANLTNNGITGLWIDGKPVRRASLGGKVFYEKHNYNLSVVSDKDILSYADGDSATLTARLTDYGEPVAGETVLIYDSDNVKHNDPVVILSNKEYESVSLLCRGEGEITFTGCDILRIYDGTNLIRSSNPNSSLTFKITVSNNVLKLTLPGTSGSLGSYNLTESEVTLVFNMNVNIIDDSWEHFYYKGVTDSNGECSVVYDSKGTGDLNIHVDCMNLSEIYEVCDCKYYIPILNNSLEYGGIHHQGRGKTTVELSNEWSTVGDYSIKGTTIDWGWFAWRYVNQIDNPTVKFDVNTDYPISAFLYVNNSESVSIDIPSGVGTYELTIDTSEITNDRVELRIVNKSSLYTATCYIDNIRLF